MLSAAGNIPQGLLDGQSASPDLPTFACNLLLAAALAWVLGLVFVRTGQTLSNRRLFAFNLLPVTCTTMFIVSVVQSSFALSLGLVGALSIVRFRAAIKEPEELAFLFLAIAVGVGLGANQPLLTLIGFGVIAGLLMARRLTVPSRSQQNLHLSVAARTDTHPTLRSVVEVLQRSCRRVALRRCDEDRGGLDAAFLVELGSLEDLERCKSALLSLDPAMKITFLENQHLPTWN